MASVTGVFHGLRRRLFASLCRERRGSLLTASRLTMSSASAREALASDSVSPRFPSGEHSATEGEGKSSDICM